MRPTSSIAFPKNFVKSCSAISCIVQQTIHGLTLSFAVPINGVTVGGKDVPIYSCHFFTGTCGQVHFEGHETSRHELINGITFKLRSLYKRGAILLQLIKNKFSIEAHGEENGY